MKYFLTLLIAVFSLAAMTAQVSIEYKPGRTDSARWEYRLERIDGAVTIHAQPYDTLPEVLNFGDVLFLESGFIGNGRIFPNSEFYSESVLKFLRTTAIPISDERRDIANEMTAIDFSRNPILQDTSLAAEMRGLWFVASAACGMPNDTMEFYTIPGVELLNLAPVGGAGNPVSFLGDGVLSMFSTPFSTNVTIIREFYGQQWRGANGCVWAKLEEEE